VNTNPHKRRMAELEGSNTKANRRRERTWSNGSGQRMDGRRLKMF